MNLQDIRDRISLVLRGGRRGPNAELRLAGDRTYPDRQGVGGVWRGSMSSGHLRMQVLVTIRNHPPPGTATWYATGISKEPWSTSHYDTNLGPVLIKTHAFNPEGHYYEVEGFGEAAVFEEADFH